MPRREDTARHGWRQARDRGLRRTAALGWLLWRYGARYTLWLDPDTLEERMAADLAGMGRKEGLDPYNAASHVVRTAARYCREWLPHLAHYRFGRPKDWREDRGTYWVGQETAMRTIEQVKRDQELWSEAGAAVWSGLRAQHRALTRSMRKRGSSIDEITEALGISRRTVFNHLKGWTPDDHAGVQKPT